MATRDRNNLKKLLGGGCTQHQMSEGSADQQLEGSLRDMYKLDLPFSEKCTVDLIVFRPTFCS